jgi:hypothetical protein
LVYELHFKLVTALQEAEDFGKIQKNKIEGVLMGVH